MRGYFGIGAEGISKEMNVGNLFRTAHAFDASFVFTLGANYSRRIGGRADTPDALGHMPFYEFPDMDSMSLPKGCKIVGIELLDESIELPSFHHPAQGPERGHQEQNQAHLTRLRWSRSPPCRAQSRRACLRV